MSRRWVKIEPKIERAVIEVNGGCNYSCDMCPQTDPGRHKGFLKQMKIDEFKRVVEQCKEKGVKIVNLEGSGEATLVKRLPEYIQILTDNGIKSYIYSNGFRVRGQYMKDLIDSGLSRLRFSVIGYSPETYKKWMNIDCFDRIKNQAIEAKKYINETGAQTEITSYHLILDNDEIEWEIEQYKKNFIEPVGALAEVWKMHNWSGVYDNPNERQGGTKTCGRPFAPEITIRAGGLNGKTLAVHPCCQVLGRDEEAVLGHLSEQGFDEVWNGKPYQDLRKGHIEGDYPDYCKSCDFLIDDPEVLVYTNFNRSVHNLAGTSFSLDSYRGD
jgi:MoaA/NifB/PqqE/SkfB family radical SAM enzyme